MSRAVLRCVAPRLLRYHHRTYASKQSVDAKEVAKFDVQAAQWWDPKGVAAPLHRMNPTRVGYIRSVIERVVVSNREEDDRPLSGVDVVDVGCGGGLVTEPLARLGANVLGIDMSEVAIEVAREHAKLDLTLSSIEYERGAVEQLVERGDTFDAVLALEIVEHVQNPAQFIRDCAALVAPGGVLLLSTINRTPMSYLAAIVAAERLLGWLPRGTHDWNRFPRPEEVAEVIREDTLLSPVDTVGVALSPLTGRFRLARDTSVNYIIAATRSVEDNAEAS